MKQNKIKCLKINIYIGIKTNYFLLKKNDKYFLKQET